MKLNQLFIPSALVAITACGGGSGTLTVNIKSLSAATNSLLSTNTTWLRSTMQTVLTPFSTTSDFGASAIGAGGLESYKVYIKRIQFCTTLTTTGTAYQSSGDCSTIYTNDADNYDTFAFTEAAAAGAGKYFDMLSATDRQALTQSVAIDAGTYNYGIIDWYKPIKITATVPLGDGTHALHTQTCTSSGCTYTSGDMSSDSATAEEAIYDSGNGGTWFKFLQPFTVAKGDAVAVDLAFDLDKRVFGGDSVSNGNIKQETGCTNVSSGYCGIYAPVLRMMPVPRASTASTMVETYEMTGPSNQWKIRVDLYYNSADTNKTVLAADIFPIPTANTATSIAAGVMLTSVTETGGVTTFKNYDDSTTLTDFTRGDMGTATLSCPVGASLIGCTEGSTAELSWTSRTVKVLDN